MVFDGWSETSKMVYLADLCGPGELEVVSVLAPLMMLMVVASL